MTTYCLGLTVPDRFVVGDGIGAKLRDRDLFSGKDFQFVPLFVD